MHRRISFVGRLLGWVMVFGVSLALAGCGGEPPAPKAATDAAPTPPSPEGKKPAKVGAKGKSMLVEGGEMSARDRRAANLKEKKAAGQ
jgi:hypothetical protein